MNTVAILLLAAAALALGWWVLVKLKKPLAPAILLATAIMGLFSTCVMQPGSIPDETAHIQTAYRYANVLLFKPYAAEDGGIYVRREDVSLGRFSRYATPYKDGYAEIAGEWRFFCTQEGAELVVEEGRNVSTGFIAYLPSAVGMALARILHLGTWPMVYLARLFNLAFFVVLMWLAVRITPIKKTLFALIGLIPTCLQAAGSVSYDAPMIGLTVLILAYLLRLLYTDKPITWREWALCAVAAFLLFPCKFVYSSVFLLLLCVPRERFHGMGRKVLFLGCVIAAGAAGFVVCNMQNIALHLGAMTAQTSTSTFWQGEIYTAGWVIGHPIESVKLIMNAVREQFDFYVQGMFVGRLGRFSNTISWTLILAIVYVLAAMRAPEDIRELGIKPRLVCLSAFALTAIGSFVLMLIMYTPVGSEMVQGVQGRYFLPALPMLLLFLDSGHIQLDDRAMRWLTAVAFSCSVGALADAFRWTMNNQF